MKYTIDKIVIGVLLTLLVILFVKYKKVKKDYNKLAERIAKIESVKDGTIVLDSIKYEKADEIWKKTIVIHDTIVTDDRTLYLVDKYK